MKALVIGGGIGGLSAALCLDQRGIEVDVFEQADGIRELGVGINLLPHAVKELSDLGLLERLDMTGVGTKELIYCNRFGQRIWIEPRGLDAGYAWTAARPALSGRRGADRRNVDPRRPSAGRLRLAPMAWWRTSPDLPIAPAIS